MTGPPPTLQYLAEHSGLTHIEAFCNAPGCGHNGKIPIASLDPSKTLDELRGKLRCRACGSKNVHPMPDWTGRDAPGLAKGWNVEG